MTQKILEKIQESVSGLALEINIDSDLAQIMDSITFIKIIVELENKFDFEFEDDMLLISNFPSVKDLIEYVKTRID